MLMLALTAGAKKLRSVMHDVLLALALTAGAKKLRSVMHDVLLAWRRPPDADVILAQETVLLRVQVKIPA